jgi:hypothetical protein
VACHPPVTRIEVEMKVDGLAPQGGSETWETVDEDPGGDF